MSTSQHYDAVIIGSGQGGEPLAVALAQAGRTLFIEREHIGGTCVNTGCTPTKTIIASGLDAGPGDGRTCRSPLNSGDSCSNLYLLEGALI